MLRTFEPKAAFRRSSWAAENPRRSAKPGTSDPLGSRGLRRGPRRSVEDLPHEPLVLGRGHGRPVRHEPGETVELAGRPRHDQAVVREVVVPARTLGPDEVRERERVALELELGAPPRSSAPPVDHLRRPPRTGRGPPPRTPRSPGVARAGACPSAANHACRRGSRYAIDRLFWASGPGFVNGRAGDRDGARPRVPGVQRFSGRRRNPRSPCGRKMIIRMNRIPTGIR